MGKLPAHLRTEQDLFISELVLEGAFDSLSPLEVGAALSMVIGDGGREMDVPLKILKRYSTPIASFYRAMRRVEKKLSLIQRQHDIESDVVYNTSFVIPILFWARGESWLYVMKYISLEDGDLVRAIRRVIDLLHQLYNAPLVSSPFRETIRSAIAALDRDIIQVVV